jgi:hypothetical protein
VTRATASDILLGTLADQRPYMLAPGAVKQDITPASTRRSDGDTRFQRLNTEGYRARTDWSGGHGMLLDGDPVSYWTGIVDSSVPSKVLCPQDGRAKSIANMFPLFFIEHGAQLFACVRDYVTPNYQLAEYVTASDAWFLRAVLPAKPTCGASFRNKVFIGYDGANRVQSWDGAALANEGPAPFFANVLAGYVTQLHYLYVGAGNIWVVARFDPDNADLKDVAKLPIAWSAGSTYVVKATVSAFGSLFFTFPDSLWSYTSQTGNIGQAAGPLDRWAPAEFSGVAVEAHDGALFYNAGYAIRRFVPGGGAKPVYPVAPRQADSLSWGEPTGLRSIAGRLYVAWTNSFAPPGAPVTVNASSVPYHLSVWTGAGMHHIGQYDMHRSLTNPYPAVLFGWDRRSTVFLGSAEQFFDNGTANLVTMRVPAYAGDMAVEQSYWDAASLKFRAAVWYSSIIDGGLRDVLKSERLAKALADLGASSTLKIEYQLDRKGGWTTLASQVTGAAAGVTLYSFLHGSYLKHNEIQFRYTLTPTTPGGTPVVYGLMEQPSSIMPIANGFRVSILVGADVEDYTGKKLYVDPAGIADAALTRAKVEAERAFLEGLRTDADAEPLYLTWLDGTVYRVRANTRTVQWQGVAPDKTDYWMISFDLSEIQ